jgi:hypothetical protein
MIEPQQLKIGIGKTRSKARDTLRHALRRLDRRAPIQAGTRTMPDHRTQYLNNPGRLVRA